MALLEDSPYANVFSKLIVTGGAVYHLTPGAFGAHMERDEGTDTSGILGTLRQKLVLAETVVKDHAVSVTGDLEGNIALIERSTDEAVTFEVQARAAKQAGAIAVVFANAGTGRDALDGMRFAVQPDWPVDEQIHGVISGEGHHPGASVVAKLAARATRLQNLARELPPLFMMTAEDFADLKSHPSKAPDGATGATEGANPHARAAVVNWRRRGPGR